MSLLGDLMLQRSSEPFWYFMFVYFKLLDSHHLITFMASMVDEEK